jgi:hypothetical protein
MNATKLFQSICARLRFASRSLIPRLKVVLFAAPFFVCNACSLHGSSGAASTIEVASAETPAIAVRRPGFLGAFFRPSGVPPYGVFSVYSKQEAPEPYPTPSSKLFGATGYCDRVANNGLSLSTGYLVDKTKLNNIVDLGVKWTRTGPAPFFDDTSHTFGYYSFGDFDSAQCALARHNITPTVELEAGPVQYNQIEGQFAPKSFPTYKTAADYATWCSTVVLHEIRLFHSVKRYTLPGNEVNSNSELFPGGDAQIAAYAKACYKVLKLIQPNSTVYGLELNMDTHADPVGQVRRLYALGCKVGTCYDGLSIHLAVAYPIAPAGTPCDKYSLQCILDIQTAAHARVHFLIGETVYLVPRSVPDEATKADAIVAELKAYAANPFVDGVNYANVDECDLYPSGYFANGCIIDSLGNKLPGYAALKALAAASF